MKNRRIALILVTVCGVLLSVITAQAQDAEPDPNLYHIADGRLNAFDLSAPVAIYYNAESFQMTDVFGNVQYDDNGMVITGERINSLDLYAIGSDGQGTLILSLTPAEIQEALQDGQTEWVAGGFILSVDVITGTYTITAPSDFEGKGYWFSWDDLRRTLQ